MNNQDVIPYQEAIIDCAKQFRQQANALMAQLAAEYNFEIAAPLSLPKKVYRHYNNKGTLSGGWTFYFHGSHCRFEHLLTGQVLEVLFIESSEFGYINPYFFLQYIDTTPKHQWLGAVLNEHSIYIAIDTMVNEGLLTKINNSIGRVLIIAI